METAGGCEERHDRVVVLHDVVFADAQLEIEDVQKLALDPADIALAEDSRAHGPVHVLKRRVIEILRSWEVSFGESRPFVQMRFMFRMAYLAGDDKRAKEDPLIGPLFECDVEMGLGPVEIDECGQDGGYFYFGPDEDVVDHGCECQSFVSS